VFKVAKEAADRLLLLCVIRRGAAVSGVPRRQFTNRVVTTISEAKAVAQFRNFRAG